MKNLIKGIIVLLISTILLTGCISLKEFTDEELERLSSTTTELQAIG